MLTLITGVPGAGKTLLALEKLVLPLVGTTIKQRTDDGVEVEHPRTIYTNIKGLLVDHQLCDTGAIWEFDVKDKTWRQAADGNRQGFHNWHEWAKPGAVIVPDEFQRLWPPRANGAPLPPDVSALDTHRHMGVDFILITQNPNNFDRHVCGLIGRHLHVRRIANMPLAIVYEWDHASRTLQYSKSISKKPWRYDRKVFKLYHSADLHTKQPRSVPPLLFVVGLGIAAAAYFAPTAYGRIMHKGDEHLARMASLQKAKGTEADRASAAPHGQTPAAAPIFPASAAPAPRPRVLGCVAMGPRCECFDEAGARAQVEPAMCTEGVTKLGTVVPLAGAAGGMGGTPMLTGRGVPSADTAPGQGKEATLGHSEFNLPPPPERVPDLQSTARRIAS